MGARTKAEMYSSGTAATSSSKDANASSRAGTARLSLTDRAKRMVSRSGQSAPPSSAQGSTSKHTLRRRLSQAVVNMFLPSDGGKSKAERNRPRVDNQTLPEQNRHGPHGSPVSVASDDPTSPENLNRLKWFEWSYSTGAPPARYIPRPFPGGSSSRERGRAEFPQVPKIAGLHGRGMQIDPAVAVNGPIVIEYHYNAIEPRQANWLQSWTGCDIPCVDGIESGSHC